CTSRRSPQPLNPPPTLSFSSTKPAGTCRHVSSYRPTLPSSRCHPNVPSSTRLRTCGSSCATTGFQTESSNHTTISSTIVARPGTSSSISLGASCPSDCANGRTSSDQWDSVLGVALFSAIMVVLLATGVYAMIGPTAAAPWQALMGSLEGTVEELIFRGAIFRLLWSALGVWWALGLSSALFGAAHLIKPSADLMAVLGITFAGGVPMAALYLLTSRLWASIGYHIAWNFTEDYVFGAQV